MTAHEELRALEQRYARAADERDIAALTGLFHPRAEITGSRGTQTLAEWLETMQAPRAFPTSMHLIGDPLIVLEDRADHAMVDSYAVVYQLSDPATGRADLTLGVRYMDEVVLEDGHWVIRHRIVQTLWIR